MSVRINLKVDRKLMLQLQDFDDEVIEAMCEENIMKRVEYLETILKGWKTYKNARKEHRRVLLMMLMTDSEDALREYEQRVLYPKVIEILEAETKNSDIEIKNEVPIKKLVDMCSQTSPDDVGTESPHCSTGEQSGSQSSSGSNNNPEQSVAHERVDIPEIVIEDLCAASRSQTSVPKKNDQHNKNETENAKDRPESSNQTPSARTRNKLHQMTQVLQPQLDYFRKIVDHVESIETKVGEEDETVVGAASNSVLSENIALAAKQVKLALNNVEKVQRAHVSDMSNTITKMNLLKFDPNMGQSGSEVSKDNVGDLKVNQNMSKGSKKRAKKAAKKAASAAEAERKLLEEKQNRIRQAKLAADALSSINLYTKPSIKNNDTSSMQLKGMPLSFNELEFLMKVLKSGKTDFDENSEESKILKKYEENRLQLEDCLRKHISLESDYNARMRKHINQLTNEISEPSEQKPLTKEDELMVAKSYITKKLEYWKNESTPEAPHYVDMYQYFFDNCGYKIASLLVRYIPFENLPNAQFEHTMLLQYQSGKLFDKTKN